MKSLKRIIKYGSLIILFGLFFFPKDIMSQNKRFIINGNVIGMQQGIVEILIEPLTDTNFVSLKKQRVLLKGGKFKFEGDLKYVYQTRIIINDSIFSDIFFIEPGYNNAVFTLDSIGHLTVNAISKTNIEYRDLYLPLVNPVNKIIDKWYETHYSQMQQYQKNIPFHIEDSMQIVKKSLIDQRDSIIYSYILQNRKSYSAFWDLVNNVYSGGYSQLRYKSFYSLEHSLQNTYTGKIVKMLMENEKKVLVGSVFPKINFFSLGKKSEKVKINLSAKYTLLDFWFSYCGPCFDQFPKLKMLYSEMNKKDFEIIGISVDKPKDKLNLLSMIKRFELPWAQFWDINGVQAYGLGINSYPQNFLLDKDGNIVGKNLEIEQIKFFLQKNLK